MQASRDWAGVGYSFDCRSRPTPLPSQLPGKGHERAPQGNVQAPPPHGKWVAPKQRAFFKIGHPHAGFKRWGECWKYSFWRSARGHAAAEASQEGGQAAAEASQEGGQAAAEAGREGGQAAAKAGRKEGSSSSIQQHRPRPRPTPQDRLLSPTCFRRIAHHAETTPARAAAGPKVCAASPRCFMLQELDRRTAKATTSPNLALPPLKAELPSCANTLPLPHPLQA